MKWAFDDYDVARRRRPRGGDRAGAPLRARGRDARPRPAARAGNVTEGFRTLEKILELAPDTKVIVVTGQHDSANALRAVALGAYDFFAKPFDAGQLVR